MGIMVVRVFNKKYDIEQYVWELVAGGPVPCRRFCRFGSSTVASVEESTALGCRSWKVPRSGCTVIGRSASQSLSSNC